MIIETNRLLLSEITLNDTEALYAIYSHPGVIEYYTDTPIAGEESAIRFISRITAGDTIVYGIRLKENPADMIGDCALRNRNMETNTVEIGGSLLPPFWGNGIMTEAFEALLDYAKTEMTIQTVTAKTNRHNRQAIRAIKKLGFMVVSINEKEAVLSKRCIG